MSKAKTVIVPWKKPCKLRQEIRDRELGEADFAVDLNKVIFGVPGGTLPFYCDPVQFFATSYATANLRDFCRAVLRRLAGEKGGEPIINVSQTFGGGKSHTLTTLYYFTTLGEKLPRKDNTVEHDPECTRSSQTRPVARVAAVSFDKVDWKDGGRRQIARRRGAAVSDAVEFDRMATARRARSGNSEPRRDAIRLRHAAVGRALVAASRRSGGERERRADPPGRVFDVGARRGFAGCCRLRSAGRYGMSG